MSAIVRIPCGLYDHVAYLTDEGTLLHSSKEEGIVTEEPAEPWLRHPGARVERYLGWQEAQYAKFVGRAKIGQKWQIHDNCEHFVSEITTGTKQSPQFQIGLAVGALALVLLLIHMKAS